MGQMKETIFLCGQISKVKRTKSGGGAGHHTRGRVCSPE